MNKARPMTSITSLVMLADILTRLFNVLHARASRPVISAAYFNSTGERLSISASGHAGNVDSSIFSRT